jgi:hypothetical protein
MLTMRKGKTSYQLAVEGVKEDRRETRKTRSQAFFKQVGAMSNRRFIDTCLEEGVLTEDDYAGAKYAALGKIVRECLGANDETGMPFAGQTMERDEDGQLVWQQRAFWAVVDYQLNIDERIADRDANHVVAMRLAFECERRHKQRIQIPALPSRKSIEA